MHDNKQENSTGVRHTFFTLKTTQETNSYDDSDL